MKLKFGARFLWGFSMLGALLAIVYGDKPIMTREEYQIIKNEQDAY